MEKMPAESADLGEVGSLTPLISRFGVRVPGGALAGSPRVIWASGFLVSVPSGPRPIKVPISVLELPDGFTTIIDQVPALLQPPATT